MAQAWLPFVSLAKYPLSGSGCGLSGRAEDQGSAGIVVARWVKAKSPTTNDLVSRNRRNLTAWQVLKFHLSFA